LDTKPSARFIAALGDQHKLNALHRIDDIDAKRSGNDSRVGKTEHASSLRFADGLVAADHMDWPSLDFGECRMKRVVREMRLPYYFSCGRHRHRIRNCAYNEYDILAIDFSLHPILINGFGSATLVETFQCGRFYLIDSVSVVEPAPVKGGTHVAPSAARISEPGGNALPKDDPLDVTRFKSAAAKRMQEHRWRRRMGLQCLTVRVSDREVRHLISTGYEQ
jgi:hypothetical protein